MVPYFLFDCLELYMDGLLGGFFLELNSRALWMFLVFVCIYVYLRLTLYELTLALKIKTLILMNQKSVTYATIIVLVYIIMQTIWRGQYPMKEIMNNVL